MSIGFKNFIDKIKTFLIIAFMLLAIISIPIISAWSNMYMINYKAEVNAKALAKELRKDK